MKQDEQKTTSNLDEKAIELSTDFEALFWKLLLEERKHSATLLLGFGFAYIQILNRLYGEERGAGKCSNSASSWEPQLGSELLTI